MKEFLNIEQQLQLLKSRGMIFDDDDLSKEYLLRNNYYLVINCFSKFFVDSGDTYKNNTNFMEIIEIHRFDREIKSILLKSILEVEKYLKAIISYVFSEAHTQDYAYLIATNYDKNKILQIASTISYFSGLLTEYNKSKNCPNSINHYITKHNNVPFWVLSNYISFGRIVSMYQYMNLSEQNKVAKEFSKILNENLNTTSVKIQPNELLTILKNIQATRNVLAHNNKLINFKCRNNYPYIPELHIQYNIQANSPKQDVYNSFLILNCFLGKNQYAIMHNSILKRSKTLRGKLTTINSNLVLSSLGFPNDWDLNTKKISQS